jgi:hypothetical protein
MVTGNGHVVTILLPSLAPENAYRHGGNNITQIITYMLEDYSTAKHRDKVLEHIDVEYSIFTQKTSLLSCHSKLGYACKTTNEMQQVRCPKK